MLGFIVNAILIILTVGIAIIAIGAVFFAMAMPRIDFSMVFPKKEKEKE